MGTTEWWLQQFGGSKRVGMLSRMLAELVELGVACYLCTNNDPDVACEGLQRVDLAQYFSDGTQLRVIHHYAGLTDKGLRVKFNFDKSGGCPERSIFVDDSAD